MTITVEVGGIKFNDVRRGLKNVDKGVTKAFNDSAPQISKALKKALQLVATKMEERHGDPWRPGGSRKNKLFRRSGAGLRGLRRSIRVARARTLNGVRGTITAPFPLSIHESGATIRAKTARFLTIPLEAALDTRGVPLRQRATDWENTFVATSRRGNLLIFRDDGGGRITPLYVLKKEVKIPARLGLNRTVERVAVPFFRRRALAIIDDELSRAF